MAFDAAAATAAYLQTIPADVQARSIAYTEGGYWLLLWGFLVSTLITWLILRSQLLVRWRARLERDRPRPVLVAFLVSAAYLVVDFLLSLPWAIYADWMRERSYGLSKQSFGDWIGQAGTSMLVNTLMGGLFFMGLYALIRRFPKRWWLFGAVFTGLAIGFVIVLSPIAIEPLFNKYKSFPQGPTRDAIVKLAQDSGVPSDRIFVFDGSRQRTVVTANVAGGFGTTRIAVSDIALGRASLAEVRAVVGHEIGHFVLHHAMRTALFFSLLALVGFFLVHKLFEAATGWFGARGIKGISDPAGLPVLMFLMGLLAFVGTPVLNSYVRLGEIEADQYSLDHARDPDGLSSALIKTVEYRKASPGKWEEIFFHDHPGVENRVRMAMEWKARNQPQN
jgi:STE24 endopeptidase